MMGVADQYTRPLRTIDTIRFLERQCSGISHAALHPRRAGQGDGRVTRPRTAGTHPQAVHATSGPRTDATLRERRITVIAYEPGWPGVCR